MLQDSLLNADPVAAAFRGFALLETALASIELGLALPRAFRGLLVLLAPLAGSREARQEAIEHGGLRRVSRTWDAPGAPEAARERCGRQLASDHAAAHKKLLAN